MEVVEYVKLTDDERAIIHRGLSHLTSIDALFSVTEAYFFPKSRQDEEQELETGTFLSPFTPQERGETRIRHFLLTGYDAECLGQTAIALGQILMYAKGVDENPKAYTLFSPPEIAAINPHAAPERLIADKREWARRMVVDAVKAIHMVEQALQLLRRQALSTQVRASLRLVDALRLLETK